MHKISKISSSTLIAGYILIVQLIVWPILLKDISGADVTGNGFDNTLYGTMSADTINGKGGSDNLFGITGDDEISGGTGSDFIQGDLGNDNLFGDDGNDLVQGGSGNDTIDGGPGNDTLIGSFVIGSTTIRDFEPDTLICGDGVDTSFISLADNDTASVDCEIVVDTPATSNEVESPPVEANASNTSESDNVINKTQLIPLP